jgi:hypothetical protein
MKLREKRQKMRKILYFIAFISFSAAFLVSQSLVEISKKEQERREQYKGKKVRVVTNADLKGVGKKAAIMTTSSPPAKPAGSAEAGEAAESEESPLPAGEEPAGEVTEETFASFAVRTLPDTMLVENAQYALFQPDGNYAEIAFNGFLELEISANNGPGADIAVYARRSGTLGGVPTEEGIPATVDVLGFAGALHYGVLAIGENGEWEEVGTGGGLSSPERFDLGAISATTRIRIVFTPYGNITADIKPYQLASQELTMGIDAVLALH